MSRALLILKDIFVLCCYLFSFFVQSYSASLLLSSSRAWKYLFYTKIVESYQGLMRIVDTVRILCGSVYETIRCLSVCLSVCTIRTLQQRAADLLPVGGRLAPSSTALSSKCEQCLVEMRDTSVNRDLLVNRSKTISEKRKEVGAGPLAHSLIEQCPHYCKCGHNPGSQGPQTKTRVLPLLVPNGPGVTSTEGRTSASPSTEDAWKRSGLIRTPLHS